MAMAIGPSIGAEEEVVKRSISWKLRDKGKSLNPDAVL